MGKKNQQGDMGFLDLALAPECPPSLGTASCRRPLGLSTSGTETQADAFFPSSQHQKGFLSARGRTEPHPTPTAFSESSPVLPVPPS